jgi:hypothetical protein
MPVLEEDLLVDKGADYPGPTDVAEYEWRSGEPDDEGVVPLVDLTGYTAAMKVRATGASSTVLLSLTSGAGITLGGTAGTIRIAITAAQTLTLLDGWQVYDLLLTSPLGAKTKFLSGRLRARPLVSA